MLIDLENKNEITSRPGGLWGQISFGRLVDELRQVGEIAATETITHIKIDVPAGVIQYRIEMRK